MANTPNHNQNAIWNEMGDLSVYAEDGFIYDAGGAQLYPVDVFGVPCPEPDVFGHSEYVFVPIPGECSKYYWMAVERINVASSLNLFGAYSTSSNLPAIFSFGIIDLNGNNGKPSVVPIVNPDGDQTFSSWVMLEPNRSSENPDFDNYHMGVTQLQSNGLRYLFISGCASLRIFEISSTGIDEMTNLPSGGIYNLTGNSAFRSELEIHENANQISLAFGYFGKTVNMSSGVIATRTGIDCFVFNKPSASNNSLGYYSRGYIDLNQSDLTGKDSFIKGIEFSPNGKHLYVAQAIITNGDSWQDINSIDPGNVSNQEIISFNRIINPGGYWNFYGSNTIVSLGYGNHDFVLGQLEVTENGGLLLAGNNRIGRLIDANDPNSVFDPNFISSNSSLSDHPNSTLISGMGNQDLNLLIYLLPDQIDGEDNQE